MKKVFKVLGIVLGVIIIILVAGLIYFNSTYPKVSPAPAIKVAMTSERIERGKYLANHVTMCMDCHSTRDWNYFSGPAIQGTEGKGGDNFGEELGLPGRVYIKNITPAAIKNWTDGEIVRTITSGVNKDGKVLFPIMPFAAYRNLSEEDLYAIVAYIRTLKPIENEVPESQIDFPVSMIIKTLPEDYVPKKSPDKSNVIEYGKYLTTIAACADCHTKAEDGNTVAGMEFSGGNEYNMPNGSIVRSVNITPDKETGIGNWTKQNFIARFRSYVDSAKFTSKFIKVSNTEFNTPMPWTMYGGMTDEDLGAIYEYLRTLKPVKNSVERFTIQKERSVSMNQ